MHGTTVKKVQLRSYVNLKSKLRACLAVDQERADSDTHFGTVKTASHSKDFVYFQISS